jgi:hypothetical protein
MWTPTRVFDRLAVVFAFGVFVLCPSVCFAQDRTSAEELFQLGKGAMARQDLPKACGYFQASLKADFALGTLLNLAICHEQAGKIASAWSEYRMLEDRARRASPPQPDRAQFAHDHAELLRPRLSRVHVTLSAEAAAIKGLVVKIDGAPAAPELFEAGVPVDPGKRKIEASAPDYEDWSQLLTVDDERLKLEAVIPALKHGAAPRPKSAGSVDLAAIERVSAERSQRTVGFVIGGIGVASLVTGGVFGLLAIGAADDAKCPRPCYTTTQDRKPNTVLDDANDAYARADTYAWVSNVTLAAGLVGVGVGTYLILTASSRGGTAPTDRAKRTWVAPVPLAGGGALTFAGVL